MEAFQSSWTDVPDCPGGQQVLLSPPLSIPGIYTELRTSWVLSSLVSQSISGTNIEPDILAVRI